MLDRCEELKRISRGAFDIGFAAGAEACDRPGRCAIDPTGLVKGWAVDRAGALLDAWGASNYAINAGGDILVRGQPTGGLVWRVGIQHPWEHDKTAEVVGVTDAAVATSGGYERGDHVVDPAFRPPASGSLRSPSSLPRSPRPTATPPPRSRSEQTGWRGWRRVPGVEAMGITDDRRVVKTRGFDRLVVR